MKLLVNGCSFSAGSTMQGNVPWIWPMIISENFSEVHNISKAGGSNDRILRTTMNFCKKNMEDYLVIIQWTSTFRHEYYSNQYGWLNITCNVGDSNVTQLINESNKHNNSIEVTDEKGNIITNEFMLDALNDEMLYLTSINDYNVRYLRNVLTLQYFLEKKNIQTRVVFTGNIVRQPMCKDIKKRVTVEGYPNADNVMARGILLPLHHGLTENMFKRFHSAVEEFVKINS